MPQSYYNASTNPEITGLGLPQLPGVCPTPMTPPPEQHEQHSPVRPQHIRQTRMTSVPSSDNTAVGMAQSQEDSIYLSPAASPGSVQNTYSYDGRDSMDCVHDECKDGTKTPMIVHAYEASPALEQGTSSPSPPSSPVDSANVQYKQQSTQPSRGGQIEGQGQNTIQSTKSRPKSRSGDDSVATTAYRAYSQGLAPIDLLFDRTSTTKSWDFSRRRLLPEYPSHVFQSYSRYTGTQQSDRQIYNVDVTILTVDIAQCTMTGYLLIRGLTPEHDTLQTYFTGEIIGGPPKFADEQQYYSFRTANPSWGATEKTDLTHWQRFPAWRSLALHAKRDIGFAYPIDGGNWWEQENIFMRWKEHFLVPDHKTKSIAGASFEGFYYICLNQIQGKISGIYYHSKSEKYQQLELKHEGKPEVFNRGVTPCIEFR